MISATIVARASSLTLLLLPDIEQVVGDVVENHWNIERGVTTDDSDDGEVCRYSVFLRRPSGPRAVESP